MAEINSIPQPALSRLSAVGRYQRWRLLKDAWARYVVVIGGLGIIGAIVLIFFYLLYAVFPLFLPAQSHAVSHYNVPEKQAGKTLLLSMEEQNEVAVRFTDQGTAVFFAVKTGKTLLTQAVTIPAGTKIVSFAEGDFANGVVAYGLSDGRVVVVKHQYTLTYPNNVRVITPTLEYPFGQDPLLLDVRDNKRQPLEQIAFKSGDETSTFIVKTADQQLLLASLTKKQALFAETPELERTDSTLDIAAKDIAFMLINKDHNNLYLANRNGLLSYFDISDKEKPVVKQQLNVLNVGSQITSMVFLNGDLSVLIGDSQGVVSQWSMIRDAQNHSAMQKLRAFKVSDNPIVAIKPEARRKGFIAIDSKGQTGVYYTTAERELIKENITAATPVALALASRANGFLVEAADGQMDFWQVKNDHPEVSFKSLWQKVWYESYPKPDYVWQSSSASNDFEPKMSLTPLVFGTFKAAFYAMLLATPLSLMGAIYTAYFMSPAMRRYVKPSIELMGALPTVILGFLAGLWLAPFIETHLVGLFSLLMVVPLTVMFFAFSWQFLSKENLQKIPEGWDALILIPVILIGAWLALAISTPIEVLFFNGNMRVWFSTEFGIGYDQRNALIVGLAMGFAVVPTIFSIAEDAIFSVPKHLTIGSLALGATPWQTMTRVVLLTASPGIFSAIMIGLGRAIGETMIVLMATGNTPVMDWSVFQGMRTLSANIGVEMPESEVDSTHYRVLFLAALVLFMFTFIFNTLAEIIRQRLRHKYSSL
jgi:phosphate transport system permease protein